MAGEHRMKTSVGAKVEEQFRETVAGSFSFQGLRRVKEVQAGACLGLKVPSLVASKVRGT